MFIKSANGDTHLVCDFCGRHYTYVAHLISNERNSAHICDDCLEGGRELVEQTRRQPPELSEAKGG